MQMTRPKRTRLSEVARDAGVSPATASRAFAQPELLNQETLARVRASAVRLGYLIDGAARALASGRSMTIAAVVPTLDSAIFSRAVQAMQVALAKEGYQLLVASHEYSAAAEADAVRTLLSRGVDGIMLVGAERQSTTRELIASVGIPVVLTWCNLPDFHCVSVDNHRAGQLAAQHLIGLGHRRIGVVIGRTEFNDRQKARLSGIMDALEAAGVDLPEWLVTRQPMTLAGGRSGCATLMELQKPPTAIIGGIDLLAIGSIAELHARDIHVPRSMSIVGIDDLEMSAHISPSLTTVHVPTGLIGLNAAGNLMRQIAGATTPVQTELAIALVARKSSGKVAV
jgi:LacI family transcriptional regulator